MNRAKRYIVTAVDKVNQLIVQVSDPHTWVECEQLYFDYMEDYENCEITIRILTPIEMVDQVYDELHGVK